MPSVRLTTAIWLLSLVSLALTGCGSSLVEPGRFEPGRAAYPQPVMGAPATAAPTTPGPVTSGTNLPHVPLSRLVPTVPAEATALYHEVQPGETLNSVASRYHTSPDRLRKANGFDKSGALKPGQLVYIPGAQ